MIHTNDIKKGDRIKLSNGWYGTMMDNKHGNVRMALVEGVANEVGDIYAYDIVQARHNGEWMAVTHTLNQIKARRRNSDLFEIHYTDEEGVRWD